MKKFIFFVFLLFLSCGQGIGTENGSFKHKLLDNIIILRNELNYIREIEIEYSHFILETKIGGFDEIIFEGIRGSHNLIVMENNEIVYKVMINIEDKEKETISDVGFICIIVCGLIFIYYIRKR